MAPSTALTLYDIEDNLQALVDTAEGGIEPEAEAEFFAAISSAITTAVEKRDRVGQFILHARHQVENVDAEIERLRALKKSYERAEERLGGYVVRTVMALGTDAKGKYKKLEGATCILGVKKDRDSVKITDEAAVPAEFKVMTLKVPAAALEELLGGVDIDERAKFLEAVKKTECEVMKTPIAAAISVGREVAGAALVSDKYSLSLK